MTMLDGDHSMGHSDFLDDDERSASTTEAPSSGTGAPKSIKNDFEIAHAETKAVQRSKVFVYLILTACALATAAITWHHVRQEERRDFDHGFKVLAKELLESADASAIAIFRQLQTLSTSITSHALKNELPWPMVTLPHFYKRTEELGALSGAQVILFAPIVTQAMEAEWTDEFIGTQQDEIVSDTFAHPGVSTLDHATIQKIPKEVYQESDPDLSLLEAESFMLPILQYGPKANSSALVNVDINSHPVIQRVVRDSLAVSHPLLSEVTDLSFLLGHTATSGSTALDTPRSIIAEPVYDDFEEPRAIKGFVFAVEPWEAYFKELHAATNGFVLHVQDTCGSEMTFVVRGEKLELQPDNSHDSEFDSLALRVEFATFARYDGEVDGARHCDYTLTVYPSKEFEAGYISSQPYYYAVAVTAVFLITMSTFAIYDSLVQQRQKKVLGTAERTTMIVKSLFPKRLGERILAEAEKKDEKRKGDKEKMATLVSSNDKTDDAITNEPIAEFFTEATIFFADIVGFTAWSSTREPRQVFTLLETIYADFDSIANRRKVFKVETVGDCYVAVAGLPEPRKDHAIAMARFAHDCLYRFQILTHELEVMLGPDTADLSIRVGLHSGPVTAGVLRGDRARFQLFGDTVNTASRMESTSQANRIQLSQDTADLLQNAGKSHWLTKREKMVEAKGKGKLQTFWLDLKPEGARSNGSENSQGVNTETTTSRRPSIMTVGAETMAERAVRRASGDHPPTFFDKKERLVQWNVEILTKILGEIATNRQQTTASESLSEQRIDQLESLVTGRAGTGVLDEVKDAISLPVSQTPSHGASSILRPPTSDEPLSEKAKLQLFDYVRTVAAMYRDNPFHSFEHASHVTMSVVKLMSRMSASTDNAGRNQHGTRALYGHTSDPLTRFACAFSAVIHDVDHEGVSNAQLVQEQSPMALVYQNKSVAEQNSLNLAWSLLMEDRYKDLRQAIYVTESEFQQFRQILVNAVMATDIMDSDLGTQRKERWTKAFSSEGDDDNIVDRRATVLIEHLLQASDVSHTMQHWQVFCKWNGRLFQEAYKAYQEGRGGAVNPSEYWYNGELGFFELYVIPLAQKLKECGVFGVSSDEYLNYALRNQKEWMARGQQVVAEFQEAALAEYGDDGLHQEPRNQTNISP